MPTAVIVNPAAGTVEGAEALLADIEAHEDVEVLRGTAPDDVRRLAAEAGARCDAVVAAGGDGTVNEVVNGLGDALHRVRLGILPLGTGNDLCRTLGIPPDPLRAWQLFQTGPERSIDLIEVASSAGTRLCVNAASGGFSGQVDEALTDELKATWGPFAYIRGAGAVLPDLTSYLTTIAYEDGSEERIPALNVVVANGCFVAGGLRVAPHADPEDGLLDVVVVQWAPTLKLAMVAAWLLAGDYTKSEGVDLRQVRAVRVESHPGMWFNIDGELLTKEPVVFRVRPHALRVVVGPDYVAARERPGP